MWGLGRFGGRLLPILLPVLSSLACAGGHDTTEHDPQPLRPRWVALSDGLAALRVVRFDDVDRPVELALLADDEELGTLVWNNPSWSPDGTHLAFVTVTIADGSFERRIRIASAANAFEPRSVRLSGLHGADAIGLDWMARDTLLVTIATRTDENVLTSEYHRLTAGASVRSEQIGQAQGCPASVKASSRGAVFPVGSGDECVLVYADAVHAPIELGDVPDEGCRFDGSEPYWSSDGELVAWCARESELGDPGGPVGDPLPAAAPAVGRVPQRYESRPPDPVAEGNIGYESSTEWLGWAPSGPRVAYVYRSRGDDVSCVRSELILADAQRAVVTETLALGCRFESDEGGYAFLDRDRIMYASNVETVSDGGEQRYRMDLSIASPEGEPRVVDTRDDYLFSELDTMPDRRHVYLVSHPTGTLRTLLQAGRVRADEDPVLHDVALDGFVMYKQKMLAPSPEGSRMLVAVTNDVTCTFAGADDTGSSGQPCVTGRYVADLSRADPAVRLDGVEPSATVAWAPDATGVFVSSSDGLDWRTGSALDDVRKLSEHGGYLVVPPTWPDAGR